MGVIRKDYILDRYVYYAVKRGARPFDFKKDESLKTAKVCFFCKGNEHLTPQEISRIEYKNSWKMRVFPNKFAAVELSKSKSCDFKGKEYFKECPNHGVHDIVVETPHHKSQLWDLPEKWIVELFEIFTQRVKVLSKIKGIKYVSVFKNHGVKSGTSIFHSHSQIMALPKIPISVSEEISANRKLKKCAYCDILKKESKSERKIFENKSVVAFAPYASRFNYEAWIFPKRHIGRFEHLNPKEYLDLAEALKKILVKLKKMNASYNLYYHYAPLNDELHFHIEITPRTATWGGFELSTNSIINSVMPEDAAKFYRE